MDRHITTGRLFGLTAIGRVLIAPRWREPHQPHNQGIRLTKTRRGHGWILGSLMMLGLSAVPAAADVVTDWNSITQTVIGAGSRPAPTPSLD